MTSTIANDDANHQWRSNVEELARRFHQGNRSLVIIGVEGVGETSLTNAIISNLPRDPRNGESALSVMAILTERAAGRSRRTAPRKRRTPP